MKTSLKKFVAGAALIALVTMNSAFAAGLSLTGTATNLSLTGATPGQDYSGTTVTGSLNLTVNAQVLPTLTLEISSGSLNLGDLDASSVSTKTMDVTLSTNAANGAQVVVGSNTGWLASTQGDLIAFTGGVVTAGQEGYNLTVAGATKSKGADPVINNSIVGSATDTQIMSVNNPTDTAKVTVSANASIDSITPSGTYQVVHTFTVTGQF